MNLEELISKYLDGELEDYELPDEKIKETLKDLECMQ